MEPLLVPVMAEALVLPRAAAVIVLPVKLVTVFPLLTPPSALLLGVPQLAMSRFGRLHPP